MMWSNLVIGILCILEFGHCLSYYEYYSSQDDISDLYNLPPWEINALHELYTSTKGEYWLWSEEGNVWNFSQPNPMPCYQHWQGISCVFNDADQYYHVYDLILDYFNLTGPYPDSIGNLTYIWAFSTQYNAISGTIPEAISNWTQLQLFNVEGNLLSGSIEGLCKFELLELVISINQFTGTLPECFGSTYALAYLSFDNNKFHGTIPAVYGNLPVLSAFNANGNYLSGTLPVFSSSIEQISVGLNSLTGPLPEDLCNSPLLQMLYIAGNHFSSTIPESYGNLTSMQFFFIISNEFTGTFPESMGNLTNIINFNLGYNYFTGSFPSSIGPNQQQLVEITIMNNGFSGSLTSSIGQASLLQVIFLFENLFTGPLYDVFNSTIQHNITSIDVSSNLFSGSVPTEPFKLKRLQSFAAGTNCMSGSLSPEICYGNELLVLALDGLSSASSCQNRYFPSHLKPFSEIHSYGLRYSVTGSIPICLYNMTSLKSLHLSGNGIIDSLTSDDIVLSHRLNDLSLSHNEMYGSIPVIFQNHTWLNFDLSYNQFYGTLMEDFPILADNASLSLQVNRLSGPVPSNLKDANDISMLDGNLFGCRADRGDLPTNDPDVHIYECGSNSFNYTIYVWLGIMCIFVGFLLYLGCVIRVFQRNANINTHLKKEFPDQPSMSEQLVKNVSNWINIYETVGSNQSIWKFGNFSQLVRQIYFICTVFILIILMPAYIVLTHYYRTYSYEYGWTVTGIYLSGTTPAVVMVLLFIVLFGTIVWLFITLDTYHDRVEKIKNANAFEGYTNSRWLIYMVGIVIMNIAVVIGANVAYVYIEHNYDATSVKVTQIALAAFKLMWYGLIIRPVLKAVNRNHLNKQTESSIDISNTDEVDNKRTSSQKSITMEVGMVLFNNLFAPFVAVAFVSSDCFYNVFTSPPTVKATYHYSTCEHETTSYLNPNTTVCQIFNDASINSTFAPPYTYSYQCSSVFIATYAPIFVFTFIIIAFLSPVCQSIFGYIMNSWHFKKDSKWYPRLISLLPPILYPIDIIDSKGQEISVDYFESDLYVVRLINAFSILFTFGTVVPPLSIIGCVAIVNFTYFTQIVIGRFSVNIPSTRTTLHSFLMDKIQSECEGVFGLLTGSIGMVVPFAVLFYGLLLFDMLGSSVGALKALWAPILVAVVPLVLYLTIVILRRWVWKKDVEARRLSSLGNNLKKGSELNETLGVSLIGNEI